MLDYTNADTYILVTDNMQQTIPGTMRTLLGTSIKDSKIIKFSAQIIK